MIVKSFVYQIVNANAYEVRLNVAGLDLRIPASTTKQFVSSNFSNDFPVIPGVTVTVGLPTNTPQLAPARNYIPAGGEFITDEILGTGDAVETDFSFTIANFPIDQGSVSLSDGVEDFQDVDGDGVLVGDAGGTGTVNYYTGAVAVSFNAPPPAVADNIVVSYVWRKTPGRG